MSDDKPMKIKLGEDEYIATVTQVTSWTEDGRPCTLKIIYEDDEIDVKAEPHFLIGYFRIAGLEPQKFI